MNTLIHAMTAAAAALALAGTAHAHGKNSHAPANAAAAAAQPVASPVSEKAAAGTRDARTYFTDLELQTQDGRKLRFYSDMLEGRTVLINVIYTSCKDACPLITRQLLEVREHLGPLFGKEVYFVTLTSDPGRDTPVALKTFAGKQSADVPGWTFATGSKANVDQILKRLGQFNENVEEHSTMLIAGNVPAKRWSKIRANAPPALVAERLKLLAQGGPSDRPKEP